MHHTDSVIHRISLTAFALLFVLCPLTAVAQEVPTDGLQLWLRADAGTGATTGTALAAWTDQSAHGRDLVQTSEAQQPTYVADAINGQPLLRFDADDGFDSAALSRVVSSGSAYTVLRVTRQNDRGYVDVAAGQLAPDDDGTALQRFFRGQVAEVLVYDRRLSQTETETVSAVLGRRYNLSPGATAARSDDATGGTNEGIRVHGAWTITVHNPDGSVDERRQLENQLASGGSKAFATYLAGTRTVGPWTIGLDGSQQSSHACESSDGSPVACLIDDPGSINAFNNSFKTLSVSSPSSGANEGNLVLNGSFTAQRDGDVGTVRTSNIGCDSSTNPANCSGSTVSSPSFQVTTKTLSSPVSVSKDQQVDVQVVIGFQ